MELAPEVTAAVRASAEKASRAIWLAAALVVVIVAVALAFGPREGLVIGAGGIVLLAGYLTRELRGAHGEQGEQYVSKWPSHFPPGHAYRVGGAGCCKVKEGYDNPPPGAPAPHAVRADFEHGAAPRGDPHYPGAIDEGDYTADEFDSEAAYGHRDRVELDSEVAPYGNPYNRGRVAHWPAADACVDDEANNDEIDGDELATYHGRARNDAERVAAGTMNRRRDLDKYLRSECEESENRQWWGNHED
jgi:hypothetical protein